MSLVQSKHNKKPLFQGCFQYLVLFCVALVLCYILCSGYLSWYDVAIHERYRWIFKVNNGTKALTSIRTHLTHKQEENKTSTAVKATLESSNGTFSHRYHEAYPRNYRFLMDNRTVCKNKTPFLVLMVPVSPNNVAARDAIRQTWGNSSLVQGKVVVTLFMLGLSPTANAEKLKQESQRHNDLIQSNFGDSYRNLTIKTMVIMDWLATRCSQAAYAMKVDSDMFLNVDNLVAMLLAPGIPKENYLTGMLMWNRPVIRSKSSKWYVPEEKYSPPTYPTYTLGMGYVFSNDLPEKYVQISKTVMAFNIEDAYIGECMKNLGLAPTRPPHPSQFKAYCNRYDRCEFSKVITYILGSSQQLIKYWTDLKKPGPPC